MKNARLYDHLVKEVPLALRRAGLPANQCILAARLGVEVLRANGVRARAVATDLAVMNSPYSAALVANPQMTQDELWKSAADTGAWSIWVSRHGIEDVGHVAIVADERVLLDLTAHQVDRPNKQIHGEAFWFESPEFVHGQRTLLRMDDDCLWVYDPRPHDRDFVRKPAWSKYRVSRRGHMIVSERSGPADMPVAVEVRVPLAPRL